MKTIYCFAVLLSVVSFLYSCKKEDALEPDITSVTEAQKDSFFTSINRYYFAGGINGDSLYWEYGAAFQRGNTNENGGDGYGPKTSFRFWLTSNEDLTTYFDLSTPFFDISTGESLLSLLKPGFWKVGFLTNDVFKVIIHYDGHQYTTYGDQTGGSLQILKTQSGKDEQNKDIVNVWSKINCNFYDSTGNYAFHITNAHALSGFIPDSSGVSTAHF